MSLTKKVPFVYSNLATSLDGKIAPSNRSPLGSAMDRKYMCALRLDADAIICGARTIRSCPRPMLAEPMRASEEFRVLFSKSNERKNCSGSRKILKTFALRNRVRQQPTNVVVGRSFKGLRLSSPFFQKKNLRRVFFCVAENSNMVAKSDTMKIPQESVLDKQRREVAKFLKKCDVFLIVPSENKRRVSTRYHIVDVRRALNCHYVIDSVLSGVPFPELLSPWARRSSAGYRSVAHSVLATLGGPAYNARRVLIEGGGEVMWLFVKHNLIQRYHLTLCPTLVGGRDAPTLCDGVGFAAPRKFPRCKLMHMWKNGSELFLTYDRR